MKPNLFRFVTIRALGKNPASQGSGIPLYSTSAKMYTVVVSTSKKREDKIGELKRYAPSYLGRPMSQITPKLHKFLKMLRDVNFSLSGSTIRSRATSAFGTSYSAILSSSTYAARFRTLQDTLIIAAVVGEGPIDKDLLDGIRAIYVLNQICYTTSVNLREIFDSPIEFPEVMVDLMQNEDKAPKIKAPAEDPKAKEIKELKTTLVETKTAMEDLRIRKPTEIKVRFFQKPTEPEPPSGPSPTSRDVVMKPSSGVMYTDEKTDQLSSSTQKLLSKEGLSLKDLQVHTAKETVRSLQMKTQQRLFDLAGPSVRHKVLWNGQVKDINEIAQPVGHVFEDNELIANAGSKANQYMRPLGVGELRTVEEVDVKYEPGEIAHIENILQGESKLRRHVRESSEEKLEEYEKSSSETTERELETTDRFELHSESRNVVKEQLNLDASVRTSSDFGPWLEIETDFSAGYSKSKERSDSVARSFAQETTEKAATRIHEAVRQKKVTRVVHKVTETNEHNIDNTDGPGHITGIYRWVNKKYTARIKTHGVRMMYEFIIPEPAAFYRYALAKRAEKQMTFVEHLPPTYEDSRTGLVTELRPEHLNDINYLQYASSYKVANLAPPPEDEVFLTKGISRKESFEPSGNVITPVIAESFDINVPDGYLPVSLSGSGSVWYEGKEINPGSDLGLVFNGEPAEFKHPDGRDLNPYYGGVIRARRDFKVFVNSTLIGDYWNGDSTPEYSGDADYSIDKAAVSLFVTGATALSMNVVVTCKLTHFAFRQWQIATYEKIMAAYYELRRDYDEKVRAARFSSGVQIEGNNPLRNEEIEKTELKKHCIAFMRQDYFGNIRNMFDLPLDKTDSDSPSYPEINFYNSYHSGFEMQFFEQAIEWNHMMFRYYPYFWGEKSNWVDRIGEEAKDAKFGEFLRAGAARVILPVREGYEDVLAAYFKTGKILENDPGITFDSDLFVDIIDEYKEAKGQMGQTEQEMQVYVPTNLVVLDTPEARALLDIEFNSSEG